MTQSNSTRLSRRSFLAGTTAIGLAGFGRPARAQGERITMVVGFPPGGAPDLVARVVAEALQARTGRSTIVENKPGANGQIAMQSVLNATGPNQGLTITLAPAEAITLVPHIKKLPYNPMADFVPIGPVSSNVYGLAVGPLSKTDNFKDFLAWAKAHPKESTFGTPGVGTPHHLLGMRLSQLAKFEFNHLAYRGGSEILKDVQGGTVASLFAALPLLITRQKPGVLNIVAITSPERHKSLPNVPTFAELGYPQLNQDGIMAVFASAKAPAAEVQALTKTLADVVKSDAFAKSLERFGQDPYIQSVADFSTLLKREYKEWGTSVKEIGLEAS